MSKTIYYLVFMVVVVALLSFLYRHYSLYYSESFYEVDFRELTSLYKEKSIQR